MSGVPERRVRQRAGDPVLLEHREKVVEDMGTQEVRDERCDSAARLWR